MQIKSFIIIVLFVCIGAGSFAQTKKGNFALSGQTNLNFQFSNTSSVRDSSASDRIEDTRYNFTTGFGYFIANNLVIGFNVKITFSIVDEEVHGCGM